MTSPLSPATVDDHRDSMYQYIQECVHKHPVVVFMKGNLDRPACGFSATVAHLLQTLSPVPVHAENVLENLDLRQHLKTFSQWSTFPQVYVQGQFIGGCDILMEMHKSGELKALLSPLGC